jgi:hypothetical protein
VSVSTRSYLSAQPIDLGVQIRDIGSSLPGDFGGDDRGMMVGQVDDGGAEGEVPGADDVSLIRLRQSGDNLHQRGFPGPVIADKADAVAVIFF